MFEELSETVKHWLDFISVGALIAVIVDILPTVTALLVLIWTALRIYECFLAIRLKRKELRRD